MTHWLESGIMKKASKGILGAGGVVSLSMLLFVLNGLNHKVDKADAKATWSAEIQARVQMDAAIQAQLDAFLKRAAADREFHESRYNRLERKLDLLIRREMKR